MKQLLLMRHAKSSWSEGGMPDFERPLNKRGKRVAPKMARFLADQQCTPALIISSPAARAAATAKFLSESIDGTEPIPTRYEPRFYHAPAREYRNAIATADITYTFYNYKGTKWFGIALFFIRNFLQNLFF